MMTFPFNEICENADTGEISYHFSIDELKTLYQLFEHQYIPYNNDASLNVVRKIATLIIEHELGSTGS